MISRFGLLRPSRYVPILLAGVAVVTLVPGDAPSGDAGAGALVATASTASTEPAAPVVPTIKIAEVSRKPPPEPVRQSVASVPAAPGAEADASAAAPVPDEVALLRTMRAVEAVSDSPTGEDAGEVAEKPVPEETDAEPAYRVARVGSSALNVRAGPSSSNQKLFVLRPGEPVRIAELDGGWARIVRGDGDEGWAFARYLNGLNGDAVAAGPAESTPSAAAATAAPAAAATAKPEQSPPAASGSVRYARIASDVPARAAPSPGAAQLFVLPAGERVKIAEIRGPWVHVITNSGVSGWVRFR